MLVTVVKNDALHPPSQPRLSPSRLHNRVQHPHLTCRFIPDSTMQRPTQSLDEFDTLPDDFDFSAIQDPLAPSPPPQLRTQPDIDEYDIYNETNTFSGIDLDTIAALAPPAQPSTNTHLPSEHNALIGSQRRQDSGSVSSTSTQYSFDEVDSSFLDEVDAIERNAVRTAEAGTRGVPLPCLVDG